MNSQAIQKGMAVEITTAINHQKSGKVGKVTYIGPPIVHVEFEDGVTFTFAADELSKVGPLINQSQEIPS